MCVIFKISHIFYFCKRKKGGIDMDFHAFIKNNYNDNDRIAKMSIHAPEHNYIVNTYHYLASDLAEADCSENNLYFALNPMKFIKKSIRRDKQHVARLKFLYVDLDIYKSDWSQYTPDQILMQLESEYFNRKIPAPSYVINSGRGMYLLWRIDEHVNAQPRWEKVQRYLHSKLHNFGADRAVVTDTARVLRIPGSINSKSGSRVSIMESYNTTYTYTLYEIMQEYMQDDVVVHKYFSKKKKNKSEKHNKIIYMNTPYSLYTARINDLEHLLLTYRDKVGAMRENILFLYRYYSLCITDDKEKSLNATVRLNNRLHNPLDEIEVVKATASAEKYYDNNKSFQISNRKLIEFLNIDEEEMKDMRSIISLEERTKRKAARDRKAYLRKLAEKGEQTKDYKIKARLKAVYELLEQGKSQSEICKELNISRSTFYSDKQQLKEYTYEQLCDAVSDKVILTTDTKIEPIDAMDESTKTTEFHGCPENSAHVLKRGRSPYIGGYAHSWEGAAPDPLLYDLGVLLNSS